MAKCLYPGECHGCQKWCDECGDVSSLCTFLHCQSHHCSECNRHPVGIVGDWMCEPCTVRIEKEDEDARQTERIERAERTLLDMNKERFSDDALLMQSNYIKALLAGYRKSAWDFTKQQLAAKEFA